MPYGGTGPDNAPMPVATPDRSTWTITHVEGTLGVGSLAADASDPNTVSPGARAVRLSGANAAPNGAGASAIIAVVLDGTSLVLRPWIYDDVATKWYRFVPDVTVLAATIGGSAVLVASMPALVGAKFFLQIITNTGTVSQYYWYFR